MIRLFVFRVPMLTVLILGRTSSPLLFLDTAIPVEKDESGAKQAQIAR